MTVARDMLDGALASRGPVARIGPEGPPLTVVERRRGWGFDDLDEFWRYRELLLLLTWRDIQVRYKQTVLGAAWAVLQPLASMLVFSLFFARVASGGRADVPYPLFVLAGLVPWYFFSNGIGTAGQSVVGNQNLVTKVYFPRLIIPMGAIGAGLVDLAISLALLLVLMLAYGVTPGWGVLLVPLPILGLVMAAMGVGTLLAALTVAYRDFRHAVPFLIQLWMLATPSVYLQADGAIGPRGRLLLPFNPAYGLIASFRSVLLGTEPDLYALGVSGSVAIVTLVAGAAYFRRVERSFADLI